MNRKKNIYDRLIMFFIALLAFGIIGGPLRPVRVFVCASLPFMYVYFLKHRDVLRLYRFEQFFFVFWWLWAVVSLLWTIVPSESIKHIIYLTINLNSFFVFLWLANRANCPQESVVKGWLLLFILTVPIALYELTFDKHLPISVQESDILLNFGYEVLERRFASVTFGNLNMYNTLLCYILPFSLYVLVGYKHKNARGGVILLFLLCYIIVRNSSRGAMLCLGIGLLLLGYYSLKRGGRSVLLFFIIFLIGIFFAIRYFDLLFGVIFNRFESQGFEDMGRMENILYGWDALLNSSLLGIGAGNYTPLMEKLGVEIPAPHNLFLEIGVQYGMLILGVFLYMLWRIFRKSRRNPNISNRMFTVIAICLYPFSHIIDSGYLLGTDMWLLLSSMYILADGKYNMEESC